MTLTRPATHAGTWYFDSASRLAERIDECIEDVFQCHKPARAIIAPHAGYMYSGRCAAYAYSQVDPSLVKRVFILGPSHKVWFSGCALSNYGKYATPFYDLTIDKNVYSELASTQLFDETLLTSVDKDEHSIEMHLPFIARVMEKYKDSFTIVPILVGSLTVEREDLYGRILSRYLADPQNLFVISSDFCHWGHRFRYTFYEQRWGQIHESIAALDKLGMDCIEALDPDQFNAYIKRYDNTICGRHPIAVFLQAAAALKESSDTAMSLKFLNYSQSSQCRSVDDSSVSYAAASLTISPSSGVEYMTKI